MLENLEKEARTLSWPIQGDFEVTLECGDTALLLVRFVLWIDPILSCL